MIRYANLHTPVSERYSSDIVPMESVSLRLYSDASTGKHPDMNVETQIPLELSSDSDSSDVDLPSSILEISAEFN